MKGTLVFAVACAWAGTALPAAAALQVQKVEMPGKDGTIAMPRVQPASDPVAANINDALYRARFGVFAPAQAGGKIDADSIDPVAAQDFTVTRNDRIFAVTFEGEGCGAYCEPYREVLSFDARSGRLLVPDDLLTPAGQGEALRLLRRQKVAAYTAQIAASRKDLLAARRGKAKADVIDDLQQRIALNTDCLAQANTPSDAETLAWHRLNPAPDALEVTSARCSNHASFGLDDVDEVTVRIPYAAIRAQLTPYGRAVLLGDGDGKPATVFGQILRGTVGASPVTMVLTGEDSDGVHGVYFYDRVRRELGLAGRRRGNVLELRETLDAGKTSTGTFVLTIDGLTLKGTWRDPKSARVLDATLRAP